MLDAALTIEHRGSRVPGSGDVYLRSYRGHVNVSFFIPYLGIMVYALKPNVFEFKFHATIGCEN